MGMQEGFVIGIAGGSGSGKTYLVNEFRKIIGEMDCEVISQDDYYIDRSDVTDFSKVNFDHPHSIDFEMVAKHIRKLKEGKEVKRPTYDFKTHTRTGEFKTIRGARIIILDGTMIFTQKELLELMDCKIFVEADTELRLKRRLERDTIERGRSFDSVIEQWNNQVEPMYQQYVKNTSDIADHILLGNKNHSKIIRKIVNQ